MGKMEMTQFSRRDYEAAVAAGEIEKLPVSEDEVRWKAATPKEKGLMLYDTLLKNPNSQVHTQFGGPSNIRTIRVMKESTYFPPSTHDAKEMSDTPLTVETWSLDFVLLKSFRELTAERLKKEQEEYTKLREAANAARKLKEAAEREEQAKVRAKKKAIREQRAKHLAAKGKQQPMKKRGAKPPHKGTPHVPTPKLPPNGN